MMTALAVFIATYSPMKYIANFIAVNSVKKPATISLSPSATLKGARLVSTKSATIVMMAARGCTRTPHAGRNPSTVPLCHCTIALKSIVP